MRNMARYQVMTPHAMRHSLWLQCGVAAVVIMVTCCDTIAGVLSGSRNDSAVAQRLGSLICSANEDKGSKLLAKIRDEFPIDEKSAAELGERIDELLSSAGPMKAVEPVYVRDYVASGSLKRFAFLSYHDSGPVLWEIDLYSRAGMWRILKIKFSADDVLGDLGKSQCAGDKKSILQTVECHSQQK